MMMIPRRGLVRFGRTLINLEQVKHCRIREDTTKGRYAFRITFTNATSGGGNGKIEDYLEWSFNTLAQAEAKFEEFTKILEVPYIAEIP